MSVCVKKAGIGKAVTSFFTAFLTASVSRFFSRKKIAFQVELKETAAINDKHLAPS